MTDKEILTAVIEKSVKNGYKFRYDLGTRDGKEALEFLLGQWIEIAPELQGVNSLLFDTKFAKAFFGEEEVSWPNGDSIEKIPMYENQIMRLALSENRLQYLKKFL